MIDLAFMPTTGVGVITKISGKRDAGAETHSVMWDVEMSFDIDSEEDAATVDKVLPGTLAVFNAESEKITLRDGNPYASAMATLSCEGKVVLDNVGITFVANSIKRIKSALVLTTKFRVHRVSAEEFAGMWTALGEEVSLDLESMQANLPFGADKTLSVVASEGDLITTKEGMTGIVSEVVVDSTTEDIKSYSIVDIDGELHDIGKDDVDTALSVRAPDGLSIADVLNQYKMLSSTRSVKPRLEHIITALGESYADGTQETSGVWLIDSDVVARALDLARSAS